MTDNVKCFVLYDVTCKDCAKQTEKCLKNAKENVDIEWIDVDCMEEFFSGRMPFPPLMKPTLYFYKDMKEFPIIYQGPYIEPEFTRMVQNIVEDLNVNNRTY